MLSGSCNHGFVLLCCQGAVIWVLFCFVIMSGSCNLGFCFVMLSGSCNLGFVLFCYVVREL